MDDWENLNETSLPERKDIHIHLNMGHITDADYAHAKRISENVELKNLWDYNDFYVQSNTSLLVVCICWLYVFENFRNMLLEIYELDPAHFLCSPGFA